MAQAVRGAVDRGVVQGARAGDEHRRLRPDDGKVPRPVAGRERADEEGRRAADRPGAADAQHGLAEPAHRGGEANRRAGGAVGAHGRHAGGDPPAPRPQGAEMIGKTIADLTPGDHAELTRVVEDGDIAAFVDAVGDYNPVHSDPAYAATTPFKAPIAPGIFTAGLISAVIGTQLPGPGAIYLSQSLKFVKPVKSGDRITARVEVIEVIGDRNRIRLQTVCVNQNGEEVLSGEAWVMPSKTRVVYEPRPRSAAARLASLALQPWAIEAQSASIWGAWSLAVLSHSRPRRDCPA